MQIRKVCQHSGILEEAFQRERKSGSKGVERQKERVWSAIPQRYYFQYRDKVNNRKASPNLCVFTISTVTVIIRGQYKSASIEAARDEVQQYQTEYINLRHPPIYLFRDDKQKNNHFRVPIN